MLQLANRLGLDLADALAGDFENSAHFFKGVCVAVAQAIPKLDNLALAVGEGLEHLFDLVLEHFLSGGADGRFGAIVLDEVAEIAILAFTNRAVEADGMPADLEDAASLLDADTGRLGRLLNRRLPTHLLEQLLRHVAELAHRLDHVHRNADGAGLIGDGPGDGLSNPPGGIGAE